MSALAYREIAFAFRKAMTDKNTFDLLNEDLKEEVKMYLASAVTKLGSIEFRKKVDQWLLHAAAGDDVESGDIKNLNDKNKKEKKLFTLEEEFAFEISCDGMS